MDHHHRGIGEKNNDQRKPNDQDYLDYWHKVNHPSSPMPENNQFSFPTTIPPLENRLPTFNPYHLIQKTAFLNTAYDPSLFLEADFGRLNLSTPSGNHSNSHGPIFDQSFLQNPLDSSSFNDYNDLNLQRMRVESAVRGQTGLYNGFSDPDEEFVDGFGLNGFQPTSMGYVYNNNGYGNIGGLNRWSGPNRVSQDEFYELGGYGAPGNPSRNGFSSVYGSGYGAPTSSSNRHGFLPAYDSSRNGFSTAYNTGNGAPANNNSSNRNGFQPGYGSGSYNRTGFQNGSRSENGFRRRGRSGAGSGADKSGGSRFPSANSGAHLSSLSERLKARPFEQWRGNIVYLAKDQHGYALLKKKIEEKKEEEIELIFLEVKDHVRELMVDQYGNYPVQKIFEVCNEDQMTQMLLLVVSDDHYLMSICVDTHGTRAMQKMLELLTTPEQVSLVMSVICRITLVLAKNMSGYRVIECCLKSFTNEQNKQLLYVIANNCADIAMDQAGCCVLQQCVLHAEGEAQEHLINGLIANTLVLSENIYGNYVVQYILGLQVPHYIEKIMAQLSGSYVTLAMNKYGSNVVERCIRDSNEQQAARIIREIYNSPNFLMVLQDPYGNYVTQTALEIAKGGLRHTILTLIEHHQPYLQSHPHGKRVLAKTRGNGKQYHRGHEYRR